MSLLLLIAVSLLPADWPARDSVDCLERNSLYDDAGRLVFVQIIGWRADHVRFWRLEKEPLRFERDHARGGYVLRWQDGDVAREVRAPSVNVTHEQYDREIADRELLPQEKRRGLRNSKRK